MATMASRGSLDAVEGRDRRARRADGRHRLRDAAGRRAGGAATGGRARLGAVHHRPGRRGVLLDQGPARGDPRTTGPTARRTRPTTLDVTTQAEGGHDERPRTRSSGSRRRPGGAGGPGRRVRRHQRASAAPRSSRRGRRCASRIGTQEFPEARILGELWRQALAVNGYAVDLRKGVGPAEDLDQALRDGDIDGYVAYTGTVLSIVAGEEVSGLDPDETYEQARAYYATQDMAMSEMTPFENKDAIATTTAFAEENDLSHDRRPRRSWTTSCSAPGPSSRACTSASRVCQQVYGLTNADVRAVRARGAVRRPRQRRRPTPSTRSRPTRSSRPGTYTLLDDPELLFGSQNVVMVVERGQARLDRRRRLPARGRRGQRRAERGRHGPDERPGHRAARTTGGWRRRSCAASGLMEPLRAMTS